MPSLVQIMSITYLSFIINSSTPEVMAAREDMASAVMPLTNIVKITKAIHGRDQTISDPRCFLKRLTYPSNEFVDIEIVIIKSHTININTRDCPSAVNRRLGKVIHSMSNQCQCMLSSFCLSWWFDYNDIRSWNNILGCISFYILMNTVLPSYHCSSNAYSCCIHGDPFIRWLTWLWTEKG